MGGQRIGNPHQVLHDAQIPAFMTITANRYTYSADSTHGQGTLAQMELATTSGSTSSVLLNRLYLSPNNPYATTQPLGQVWPYPNYQTYQGVLLNSQQAGYLGTTAQDGKDYLFKTLTAASSQAFTILIKELPNTPQFRAASDPAGGGVGVRVEQNGDAAALANYYKTVQPYDFTWRPNAGLYTGAGNGSGQNAQLDPMYSGWANSPGGAYSGANYAEGGGAPQSFNDFIKQQQAEALANDKRVRSQTTANSLDLSNTNVNTLFGEGYNLFDYGNKTNPNLAAENEYLRKLQNGEFNAGSADYTEASRIAQERYRIAYATRLETNKPLQYSVADSQRKANELNLVDTNPNKLFGDGYDLFNYDPLTNPNGAAENALLTRLQNGQLTPGTTEYEEAKSIAQQRYRNAYSNSLAFNIAPKFSVAEAQRKANEIDLSQVNPNELFGQGFDLFQYNPALRPNGEAENDLMAKLQNGELTVGSPEYLEATQIAQQRLRDAYSISLVPPEPKKKTWWKEIVILVVAAIAVYFTAGAASAWLGELAASSAASTASAGAAAAGAGAAGQAAAAGAAYASTLTAAASSSTLLGAAIAGGSAMAGSYAGAVIGTGLSTGSLSQGLRAGEIALTRGSIQTLATVIVLGGLGLTGLDDVLGSTGTSIVSNSIGSAAATSYLSGGSFGDALLDASLQNIVNIASAGAAKEIGTQFPNLDGTNLLNYAAHAGLGCASASATGGNCAAGAAGAAAGEAAAATGLLNFAAAGFGQTLTDGGTVFFGGLVGGTVASAVGSNDSINANFATGQATAQNAVTNNYLNHKPACVGCLSEAQQYENADAECAKGVQAACDRKIALVNISKERDKNLDDACKGSSPNECARLAQQARDYGNQVTVYASGGATATSSTLFALNPGTIGVPSNPRDGTFHDTVSRSTSEAILVEGGNQLLGTGLAGASKLLTIATDGLEAFTSIGIRGSVADANFAQTSIRSSELFTEGGINKYSQLAGTPINTVDDLVNALRTGSVKPGQITVDYVITADGTSVILNTRTSIALNRAGIPQSQWFGVNRTGVTVPKAEVPTTFDELLNRQLANNKLPPTGTPTLPQGKK
jgi:hypothetical protein